MLVSPPAHLTCLFPVSLSSRACPCLLVFVLTGSPAWKALTPDLCMVQLNRHLPRSPLTDQASSEPSSSCLSGPPCAGPLLSWLWEGLPPQPSMTLPYFRPRTQMSLVGLSSGGLSL